MQTFSGPAEKKSKEPDRERGWIKTGGNVKRFLIGPGKILRKL